MQNTRMRGEFTRGLGLRKGTSCAATPGSRDRSQEQAKWCPTNHASLSHEGTGSPVAPIKARPIEEHPDVSRARRERRLARKLLQRAHYHAQATSATPHLQYRAGFGICRSCAASWSSRLSQSKCLLRQCFRTASVDAYSLLQPG